MRLGHRSPDAALRLRADNLSLLLGGPSSFQAYPCAVAIGRGSRQFIVELSGPNLLWHTCKYIYLRSFIRNTECRVYGVATCVE
jgi:hypothetical protein